MGKYIHMLISFLKQGNPSFTKKKIDQLKPFFFFLLNIMKFKNMRILLIALYLINQMKIY